jgi:hypothetical protein
MRIEAVQNQDDLGSQLSVQVAKKLDNLRRPETRSCELEVKGCAFLLRTNRQRRDR